MHPNNPCDHSAVALAMTVTPPTEQQKRERWAPSIKITIKPHLRLHVMVGAHSGGLYWRVLRAGNQTTDKPADQWHTSERAAYDHAKRRLAMGLV